VSERVLIPDAALAALEAAVNRYIGLDPEGAGRLAELHGRIVLIEVAGFGTRLFVIPGTKGLQLYSDYAEEPDCVLRGSPLALARMGVSHRKEDQLFSGEVQIEGDTHLAQAFGDLVGGLEVDWEEQLSLLVGDGLAHEVGSRARAAGRWGRSTGDTLAEDVKEYLQEETRLLPGRYEIQGFLDDVDHLRDGVERLAARVERLAKKREDTADEQ
jgi:ubiquinone biosynthesis accessory factor UbiJ